MKDWNLQEVDTLYILPMALWVVTLLRIRGRRKSEDGEASEDTRGDVAQHEEAPVGQVEI